MAFVGGDTGVARPVPRIQITALYAAVATTGFLPFAVVAGSWPGAVVALVAVCGAAFLATRECTTYMGVPPTTVEITLALFGYSAGGAACGFLGFAAYFLINGGIALVAWVFGFDIPAWADVLASYGSFVPALFFLFAIASTDAAEIIGKLYPARDGYQPSFAKLLAQPRGRYGWYLKVIGSVALLALVFLLPSTTSFIHDRTWAVVLELSIVFAAGDFWATKSPEKSEENGDPKVLQIKELLQIAGYRVRISPRSGDPGADSLIGLIDFLAIRSERAIAGRITTEQDPLLLSQQAASLQPAIWALADWLWREEQTKIDIEPVIVIFGGSTSLDHDPAVSANIDRMYVRIIRSPSHDELIQILGDTDTDRKKKRARELFDPGLDENGSSESSLVAEGG